jgi:rhodanese-related sulfurtransferase
VDAPGRTLEELLVAARARIGRLTPPEALAAAEAGALIVDIRSDLARAREGAVPRSLHIPRTVLEWRLAPDSAWRTPHVAGLDARLVVICDHGYSSSFAAAMLLELGYTSVADVVGGFQAWREQGLPVAAAPPSPPDGLPGMAPPT